MSHHDYEISKKIKEQGYTFYAIIMAAMRQACAGNIEKLKKEFPETFRELQERYDAPGGYLEGEVPYCKNCGAELPSINAECELCR